MQNRLFCVDFDFIRFSHMKAGAGVAKIQNRGGLFNLSEHRLIMNIFLEKP
mgnify:FL=1